MRIFILLSLLLMIGCKDLRDGYEKGFKEEFQKSFTKSCASSAVKKGMNEAKATEYCACTARELASRHSSQELMKIAASDKDGEVAAAVKACTK